MLSATLPSRLLGGASWDPIKRRERETGGVPQVSHDALMPADAHGLVKVVVSDADVVAPHALGDVQVPRVRCGQVRFCVLGPEEIYGVDVAVLLRQVREVPLKRWL